MQMYHVGFTVFIGLRDVDTGTGGRHGEQILTAQSVGYPYHHTLPQKTKSVAPVLSVSRHINGSRLFVGHHHSGLYTVVYQRLGKPAGCDRGTARTVARIHYKYSHRHILN